MQLSRRVALVGVTAALIAPVAGCTPAVQPAPTTTPSATVRRGVNISPRRVDYVSGFSSPWSGLWVNWDWAGTIKRDIDLGVGLGSALIRVVGAPQAVLDGLLPRDVYLQRLEQVLDYCERRGVQLYPCGGTLRGWSTNAFPSAQIEDLLVAQASVLQGRKAQVFGFDLINELAYSYREFDPAALRSTVAGWARSIRAVAPEVRLTVSNITRTPQTGFASFPEVDAALDFYDFHLIRAMPVAALASWRKRKPVVIGEIDVRRTDADRQQRYEAIVSDSVAGGAEALLAWDVTSNDFGLYDAAGQNLDPQLAAGFASIPSRG